MAVFRVEKNKGYTVMSELDNCAACGKPFMPQGKQAYCSPACAEAARRKRQREYMREKRRELLAFGPYKSRL